MAISKVVYGDDTLMDITDSTVDSSNMLNGTVGYSSAGERTVGTYVDSDEKVKQENTTTNADYRVLFSNGANDTTETKTARKSTKLKFNPNSGNLVTTKLNGNTVPTGTGTIALTSDIPTPPTVNNSTITIQKNGTDVDSFTTNASSAKSINITMAKGDVGLSNVPNVTTNNQTPTFSEATTRANIASGEKLSVIFGKIMKWFTDLKDLAFIAKDGNTTTYLRGDGTWQAFPTIPTVNDATLTIQKNGTTVKTFTANASSNVTCNITVPTKTSDITNDSGFVTTDEKVKQTPLPFNTGSSIQWYRLALGRTRDNNEETNAIYKTSDLVFSDSNEGETSTTPGKASLRIGNTVNSGNAGNQYGEIQLAGKNNRVVALTTDDLTATHYQTLQNKDGTIALTSDIPTKTSDLTNDSGFVTTDNKVAQKPTPNDNSNYRLLMSKSANNNDETDFVRKCNHLYFNTSSYQFTYNPSHTDTAMKNTIFVIGNNKVVSPSGTEDPTTGVNRGVLRLFGTKQYYAQIYDRSDRLTDNRNLEPPDKSGVIAVTTDISDALDWKSVSIGYQPADFVEVCPTTCREIIFDFYGLGATGSTQIPCYTSLHLAIGMVTAAEKTYRTGWYQSNGNGGKATLVVKSANNKIYAKFIEFYINTSNVPSGSCTAYYR